MVYGAIMLAALWLATVAASDNPLPVITAFWVVVGAIVLGWSRFRDVAGDPWVTRLKSALQAGAANVYDVRAVSFVEIEEVNDEGGGFVFQLECGESLLFLDAIDQRASGKFPSLDFSVVEALDEKGNAVARWIDKRGVRVSPMKRLAAETAKIPHDLSEHRGRIDDIEEILR